MKLKNVVRLPEKKGTGCKSPEHKEYHCFGESDCPECEQALGYNDAITDIGEIDVVLDKEKAWNSLRKMNGCKKINCQALSCNHFGDCSSIIALFSDKLPTLLKEEGNEKM